MKTCVSLLFVCALVLASGCAAPTPIQKLALPPVSIIAGTVAQLDENGFRLTDKSGSIWVRAQLPGHPKLDLSENENVTVYGNLQGGPERIFDGYVVRKATGEQILISEPTPHFGFIIQSAFKP